MMLRRGLRTAVVGLVAGLIGAAALTRLLSSFLYGVDPLDPVVFLAVSALLVATAVVACLFPARAAGRTDPMEVLRSE